MIKFEYRPWTPDIEFDSMMGPPTVEQVTMTLGDDVSWDEAVCEFRNLLRAAGYVIPYDFEEKEEREWVGFSKDEIDGMDLPDWSTREEFVWIIEDKLKEKNT